MRIPRGGRGALAQSRGKGVEGPGRVVARVGPQRSDRSARRGKAAARAHFRTPLVFSVHEAKGLEYPNVILFNLVSGARAVYADLCRDVVAADLEGDELDYRRAKDKADKSLELNKFYVNALYVAMTRAMEGLAVVEFDVRHPLLGLLGLEEVAEIATGPVQRRPRTNGRRKRGSSSCRANRSKRGPYGKLSWRAGPRRGPRGL